MLDGKQCARWPDARVHAHACNHNVHNHCPFYATVTPSRKAVPHKNNARPYAVKVQWSLAPLSRFRGSHIPSAHEQQCCTFVMRTLCDRLWNLQAKLTLREPHSWDPRQRTTWSRVVTSDFNSVLSRKLSGTWLYRDSYGLKRSTWQLQGLHGSYAVADPGGGATGARPPKTGSTTSMFF